jgi:hypothetical protein
MSEEVVLNEREITPKHHNPWIELLYAPRQAFKYILEKNPYTDIQFWFLFPVCSLAITIPYWMIAAPQSIKNHLGNTYIDRAYYPVIRLRHLF